MAEEVSKEIVQKYYNEHTHFKINDFASVSPRIESAYKTLIQYAPKNPSRILEVGCGVGSIVYRMKKHWPGADVFGIDISTESIETAKKLFSARGIHFQSGILLPETYKEGFDLIVFMDVYEHIAVQDRPLVHASLLKLLNNKGRIFLSVPTPHNLIWSAVHKPHTMQPVDEHISFDVIGKLAKDTSTEVQLFQNKNIWNIGDYCHIVLEKNDDFETAFFKPKPVSLVEKTIRILGKVKNRVKKPFKVLWIKNKLK